MFQIIARDACGRIGKFKTRHGEIITPTLMPVYNPNIPLVSIDFFKKIGIKMIITNAYIIYRSPDLREKAEKGVHELLDFNDVIMTDSGAYQSWMYNKELDITNEEIIKFEEVLEPDIATILDVFTDSDDHDTVKKGVDMTLERAKECLEITNPKKEIIWAAPIQGGKFIDLVKYSALELSKLDFKYHPIGTLAPALISYDYHRVAEQILISRLYSNQSRPLHAFSIGHPMFFSLAVALGADLFDSSAYALFAKDDRYITVSGTIRLEKLTEFPCSCPICLSMTPEELKKKEKKQRAELIAKHNLYVTFKELKNIRQAIHEGSLWKLVQERCAAHPNLQGALHYILKKYASKMVEFEPITKSSAFFYVNSTSLLRPEVVRHKEFIKNQWQLPDEVNKIILFPDLEVRPIDSWHFNEFLKIFKKQVGDFHKKYQIFIVSPIFGLIPEELKEVYPLSQHEYSFYQYFPKDLTINFINNYIERISERINEFILFTPEQIKKEDNEFLPLKNHLINDILIPTKRVKINLKRFKDFKEYFSKVSK
ncbi:MAG: tRNA guanosine(15) transglycosylase TgtA [Candidatus Helarchaeota archaeon]